jgi:DNA-binding HxlR family transcriptional regulator
MARKRFRDANCSIAQTLDRVGDWWTILIVRDAFNGVTCFSDFQTGLGVAKNILSQRLARLVKDGIFERLPARPGIDRYEYHLTQKGYDLLPILIALMHWGDKWVFDGERAPWDILDGRDRQLVRPIAVVSHDGRPLGPRDVRMRPGAGADDDIQRKYEHMRAVRRRARDAKAEPALKK